MVNNAFTMMYLPTLKHTLSFLHQIIASKLDLQNILALQTNIKLLKGNRLLDITTEVVTRRCSFKKVFLQIS